MALSLGLSALVTAVPKLEQLHSYSFAAYEQEFGKIYATQAERDHRASVFANNLATIVAHNAKYRCGNSSYWMNVNTFADLTNVEFRARRTGKITGELYPRPRAPTTALPQDLPERLDYREQGVVTPIKNQGDCGSCWAFSAVESFESVFALKTKQKVPKLSPQQIVSIHLRMPQLRRQNPIHTLQSAPIPNAPSLR
jgi:C1A family cysteine protease